MCYIKRPNITAPVTHPHRPAPPAPSLARHRSRPVWRPGRAPYLAISLLQSCRQSTDGAARIVCALPGSAAVVEAPPARHRSSYLTSHTPCLFCLLDWLAAAPAPAAAPAAAAVSLVAAGSGGRRLPSAAPANDRSDLSVVIGRMEGCNQWIDQSIGFIRCSQRDHDRLLLPASAAARCLLLLLAVDATLPRAAGGCCAA